MRCSSRCRTCCVRAGRQSRSRAGAGHPEGGLILGQARSAIGTLVERTTRLLLLVLMPTHKPDIAASAFAGALNAVPAPLRRTLTCDRGKEMARHKDILQDRGAQATRQVRVLFADLHAPWQPGRNKTTNGLLRQHVPKAMPLASLTQADLDTGADSLDTWFRKNARPRKTPGFDTSRERFTHLPATAKQHTKLRRSLRKLSPPILNSVQFETPSHGLG